MEFFVEHSVSVVIPYTEIQDLSQKLKNKSTLFYEINHYC